jgi:aquaporin Z
MNGKKLAAEAIGTFLLVFLGCGAAVTNAAGIGILGVALAFGLTVLTMAYVIGPVSGCHLNPAVTIGLLVGGRFPAASVVPYIAAQFVGGILGAALLFIIASGAPGFEASAGFASTGYGEHSPGGYSLMAGLVTEIAVTAIFLFIIMGATHGRMPAGFAPIAIGLGLTLMLLMSIPVTNASLNPARSTATAIFAGGWALSQLWMFLIAPVIGGAIGAAAYRWLNPDQVAAEPDVTGKRPRR